MRQSIFERLEKQPPSHCSSSREGSSTDSRTPSPCSKLALPTEFKTVRSSGLSVSIRPGSGGLEVLQPSLQAARSPNGVPPISYLPVNKARSSSSPRLADEDKSLSTPGSHVADPGEGLELPESSVEGPYAGCLASKSEESESGQGVVSGAAEQESCCLKLQTAGGVCIVTSHFQPASPFMTASTSGDGAADQHVRDSPEKFRRDRLLQLKQRSNKVKSPS